MLALRWFYSALPVWSTLVLPQPARLLRGGYEMTAMRLDKQPDTTFSARKC